MKKNLVLGCCVAALLGVVACSGSDGGQGTQGANGSDGQPGATGGAGSNGAPGSNGSNGADGQNGANGANGSNGDAGATGATGSTGDQGETGSQGTDGDLICGDTLIHASEWHTVCGSDVGACQVGQVQCRASLNEGELSLSKVCYGEIAPQVVEANCGKCDQDLDCDGVLDDTTGEGSNVTLVKQSKQVEILVSGSSTTHDFTLVAGKCRNAAKHCLRPSNDTCRADRNGEGVLWSDFVAADHEADMGYECVGAGGTVRTWECTVTDGVASVTCTGPRGL